MAGHLLTGTTSRSHSLFSREIEATFRGVKSAAGAGQTVHIPANAPHQFDNKSDRGARRLCICSPAGQEEFFAKVETLVPQYRTELLSEAWGLADELTEPDRCIVPSPTFLCVPMLPSPPVA